MSRSDYDSLSQGVESDPIVNEFSKLINGAIDTPKQEDEEDNLYARLKAEMISSLERKK